MAISGHNRVVGSLALICMVALITACHGGSERHPESRSLVEWREFRSLHSDWVPIEPGGSKLFTFQLQDLTSESSPLPLLALTVLVDIKRTDTQFVAYFEDVSYADPIFGRMFAGLSRGYHFELRCDSMQVAELVEKYVPPDLLDPGIGYALRILATSLDVPSLNVVERHSAPVSQNDESDLVTSIQILGPRVIIIRGELLDFVTITDVTEVLWEAKL